MIVSFVCHCVNLKNETFAYFTSFSYNAQQKVKTHGKEGSYYDYSSE